MKKRNFGFTLIELLVVIVIIGILATISTATFKSYFGKARDAERQSAVQNIALMMKVDGADDWKNTKYIYTDSVKDGLPHLMAANDFRVPDGKNDLCYFIAMADGAIDGVGDDNEFVVVVWGEATSTEETGTPGLLMDGTAAAMAALNNIGTPLTAGAFSCAGTDDGLVGAAFEDSTTGVKTTTTHKYLYINADGCIVDTSPVTACPS